MTPNVPVLERHRAAAVRAVLPATTERSWVWQEYVLKGDGSSRQLRDVVRVARAIAEAEAGLLLPPELRPPEPEPEPEPTRSPLGLSTPDMRPKR